MSEPYEPREEFQKGKPGCFGKIEELKEDECNPKKCSWGRLCLNFALRKFVEEEVGDIEPISVKSIDLNSFADIQEVESELRDGNIIILKASPLLEEDPEEFKQSIERLKDSADEIGGGIGQLALSKIIITPKLVRLQ